MYASHQSRTFAGTLVVVFWRALKGFCFLYDVLFTDTQI
ncbi:hypothetical protein EYZ11_004970 [Aspergillus tanneri]|uniref:Uncharacterized protein n=1 Tax=Aspergillus tanneri TaxID=1220188 RepID=A0A4S3JJQ9_9EURO|nr:hypothetical protein EYZ11_004970 [Aspergillus tanneri]